MAKFKKGDKVVSTSGNRGVVDEVYDHEQYAVRFDGRSMPDRVEGFKLRAANSAAALSRNSVVANALAWKQGGEVAKNADDHARVRVVAETETLFGKRREEKTMTVGELRAAMARLGHGRLFADVVRDAEAGKDANPLLKLPCEAWITLA